MSVRRRFAVALALLASFALCAAVHAGAYPEKEIKLIVTQPSGGGTDAIARAVAVPLEKCLGVPVVVINQGAASGLVGITDVSKAKPDGYTLAVFSNVDNSYFAYTQEGVEFTVDDFTYIAGLNATADIIILGKNSPYKNLEEFIKAAKDDPGGVTLAIPSVGQFLSVNLLNEKLGIELTPVVYEGGGKVFADLLGGHVDAGCLSAKFAKQSEENGLVVVGLMLDERLETAPNVPTFVEQGYDILNPAIRMLNAPKGLPQEVIDTLSKCLAAGYAEGGEIARNLRTIDEAPIYRDYKTINEFLKSDFAMREKLLKK